MRGQGQEMSVPMACQSPGYDPTIHPFAGSIGVLALTSLDSCMESLIRGLNVAHAGIPFSLGSSITSLSKASWWPLLLLMGSLKRSQSEIPIT